MGGGGLVRRSLSRWWPCTGPAAALDAFWSMKLVYIPPGSVNPWPQHRAAGSPNFAQRGTGMFCLTRPHGSKISKALDGQQPFKSTLESQIPGVKRGRKISRSKQHNQTETQQLEVCIRTKVVQRASTSTRTLPTKAARDLPKGQPKDANPGFSYPLGLACISLDHMRTRQRQVCPGTERLERHASSVLSSPFGGRGGGTRLAWRETQATCPL